MILRNNSKNEWLNYHQGIDIKANSTFEVPEKEGKFILRMLGHENWVVKVREGKPATAEKPANAETTAKVAEKEDVKKPNRFEQALPKRQEMMSLLKEKGIKFDVKMKNEELLKLLS